MRLLPLLLLAFACRSSSPRETPPPSAPVAAVAAVAADAKVADAPPLSEAEKARQRDERAAAALARIPEIKQAVAKLRGLAFLSDVQAEQQSAADFRASLRRSIDDELPVARAEALSTAYTQLGLLERKLDLRKTFEDAMVSQAGGYYDPKAKKFFLVMVPSSDLMLDTITAHELTHALQDQHFDLQAYFAPKSKRGALGDDALNARRFIVEGEATLTMLVYVTSAMTKRDVLAPEFRPALEMQLGAFAKMGIDELKEMSRQQQASGFLDMGDDIRASIKAMDDVPLVLMLPLLESYGRGALPVMAAYKLGGWAEVAKLYTQPPESTEQVLHPDTKLFPTRDLPTEISLPKAPAGYQLIHSDTIGELQWRVYFLLWDKATSEKASEGWDGDRYAVLRGRKGELLTLLATTWDSEADAAEFEASYRRSLSKRFGGDGSARPDGGAPVLVQRRGSEVFVVDGAGAASLMPALIKGSKLQ
jgi:hypothetical protein